MQRVGTFGQILEVKTTFTGMLTGKKLRIRIKRPDRTSFDRTTNAAGATGDVIVVNETTKIVGVLIKTGDLTQQGEHTVQAFDESSDLRIGSEIEVFRVGPSLPEPEP